jgi:hypothetical protein
VDEYTTRAAFLSLKGMVMAPYGDIHHGGMLEGMDQTTTLLNLYKDRMYVCDYTAGKVRYVLPMIKYAGTLVTIANPKALQVIGNASHATIEYELSHPAATSRANLANALSVFSISSGGFPT